MIRNIILIILVTLSVLYQASSEEWATDAHATFYGDLKGNDTMYGACGYGDLHKQGYGLKTGALSTALFNDGQMCGACFEIACFNSTYCKPKAGTIKITATNFCPPNYTKIVGVWCNPPQKHFDLSQLMFVRIAEYRAGIVPVKYRRIPCVKRGGLKFQISGNRWWQLVLVFNVGGAGNVVNMKFKGSKTSTWTQLKRNWGQMWESGGLYGQNLSFEVTTSDGRMVQANNVVPAQFQFGQTFEANVNF